MAKIDRLGGGELADLKKRIRALEMATPLANASITRGRLRVASAEGLVVEGSASVSGVLKGLGQFLWDGIVTLTSTFTSNGPWNLNGAGTITGNSTQTGNMTVNGGGKIIVAGSIPMTVGIAAFGLPGVDFGGSGVVGLASGVLIHAVSGAVSVSVTGSGVDVAGGVTLSSLPAVSAVGKTPNLWMDPATKILYRLV